MLTNKTIKKKIPQRLNKVNNTWNFTQSKELKVKEKNLKFCEPNIINIKKPTCKKSILLKKACLIKWKNLKEKKPKEKLKKHKPIWDKVLKATIFF